MLVDRDVPMPAGASCLPGGIVEHLVKFTTAEGREGQHVAEDLDEALRFVERLRNTEEVSGVRVFRMQEIPIEFRAYYKVELKSGEAAAEPESLADEDAEQDAHGEQPLVASPSSAAEEAAGTGPGERRLFARG
jgi:hypothetical protein